MYTVKLVTKAWDDTSVNVHQLTEEVLQCLYVYFSYPTNQSLQSTSNYRFHPDFHNPQSQLQREMLQCVRDWLSKSPNQQSIIQRLNKESVRNHRNVRAGGEGGAPASQGSFAEQEGHQLQQTVMGHIPGIGLLAGNAKVVEGGSPRYPSRPGGYPQAGGQQHGGLPGPPGYPGGPMGGGGHQHGGDRYGASSTYTPPTAAPSNVTTFPMSGSSPLPPPHSDTTHHHHSGATGPHTQHGGYGPPSFPSGGPSFPGGASDGFSFPGGGAPSFPSGDGVLFPDSNASSFLGAPSFPDGGYSGPPPHLGGYNPPPGPPPHRGGGYHPPPGPPHGGGGYHAPSGPPPGFPESGGYEGSAGHLEFPGANPARRDGYNPSYPSGW